MGEADDLARLASLHQSGALSDDEFALAKSRLLSREAEDYSATGDLMSDERMPAWVFKLLMVVIAIVIVVGGLVLITRGQDDSKRRAEAKVACIRAGGTNC